MAYAALMTLSKAIDLIMPHHEDYIFLCDREQMQSLKDKVIRLQEFLENIPRRPSSREPLEAMEGRIRETAYQLEDIVESILVGSFHQYFATEAASIPEGVPYCGTSAASIPVQEALDDTLTDRTIATFASCIGEIDVLLKDSMEMKKAINTNVIPGTIFSSTKGSSSSEPPTSAETKVGLDDDLNKILDHITSNVSSLQTIFITGMGGIGKTTLARAVYELPGLQRRFDLRLWVTVSQEWNIEEILQCLLAENGGRNDHENGGRNDHVKSLIDSVYQMLYGRRYLIVLDDVWDEDVLGKLKRAFLDQNKRSRVIVTTRLLKLGQYVTVPSSQLHQMKFLSDEQSWNLLRQKVYGHEDCPAELANIGRTISSNCKGLPLAVIVIGGLLKFNKTKDYWEEVAKTTTVEASMGDESLLEILSLSYTNLPPHLKACFLYFGMFREDKEIETDELVRLWSAEGFLKSRKSKTMEEVAEECLEELVERSLVLVKWRRYNGTIRTSSIHDVLRDFSLRESDKENFLHYPPTTSNIDPVTYGKIIKEQRRVSFVNSLQHLSKSYYTTDDALLRSFIHEGSKELPSISFIDLKLLRVLRLSQLSIDDPLGNLCSRMTNLRYLELEENEKKLVIPSSISKLRNLETLIIDSELRNLETLSIHGEYIKEPIILPLEIWNMPRLRHFIVNGGISFPKPSLINGSSLESLNTLHGVTNPCLTMSVINKMLNLRSLKINYKPVEDANRCGLDNLVHLHNLQRLYISRSYNYSGPGLTNFVFPQKLKELSLDDTRIPWEKMASIGELPLLECLVLDENAFVGQVWKPSEGGFCQLKYLRMEWLDLEEWRAKSTHFPSLEVLVIEECENLKEVPGEIGEINTLNKITVHTGEYNKSLEESVERIKDEQEGNDSLQVILERSFRARFLTRRVDEQEGNDSQQHLIDEISSALISYLNG